MLITRLYLRNFRVYEDELDLEVPPGLVGIYGPNGAGKSTLLEVVLWTLWGKSRTTKEQIRSSGVGADCVTEVQFEHEGHLYLVRRSLRGAGSNVTVEAHCDGALMSTGVRDAERYIESVLGMDDSAFRASVFTEQKQLAAFSEHSPTDRRRLVMQLLGITPLDSARDSARRQARQLTADHDRLRGMLADLDSLATAAADARAAADAASTAAAAESLAAQAAEDKAEGSRRDFKRLDARRQEHDALVLEGQGVAEGIRKLERSVEQRRKGLAELDALEEELARVGPAAEGGADLGDALALLVAVRDARRALDAAELGDEPPVPDPAPADAAASSAASLKEGLAAARALAAEADSAVQRAREAAQRSSLLSGEEDCPVCGQALGEAFETVQAHRSAELSEAEERAGALRASLAGDERSAREAEKVAKDLAGRLERDRRSHTEWEQTSQRRSELQRTLTSAWSAAVARGAATGDPPSLTELDAAATQIRRRAEAAREAAETVQRIRGRLDGRPGLSESLDEDLTELDVAQGRIQALREKVKALGFDRAELDRAAERLETVETAARRASLSAREAEVVVAGERAKAAGEEGRLEQARSEHAKLSELESEARHVSRAAELLSEFRNTVVASVGPRLAIEAAELFGELTDHEYERLDVDPDNYELKILDGGHSYGLDRFSGSEIDLANLALRVAISEHIHFQSGGSVGLLVLDEVFGPLDEDRKARMLQALERLKGRFRQVLVVTHDSEIKDQLPNAIEVVKLPGRRATARVVAD